MTREETIVDTAFRHGTDGIAFYPPSWWGKDGAPSHVYANYSGEDETYRLAYADGRRHYKSVMGAFPRGGCARWDGPNRL